MKKQILAILLVGLAIRVWFIWLNRPEFVGWFNHTYYYYVQTESLLAQGKLAFPDFPFLFYLYAGTAKIFQLFGYELKSAIVQSTRFWMSLLPALTALPILGLFKLIQPESSKENWTILSLFAIAVFFPLTIQYMPEFLQKNVLGNFFLLSLIYLVYRYSLEQDRTILLLALLSIFLISITHFGTLAALFLIAAAYLLAKGVLEKDFQKLWRKGIIFLVLLMAGVTIIYFMDPDRLYRLDTFIRYSFSGSFLGTLINPELSFQEKLPSLLGIVIPLLILFGGYYFQKKYLEIAPSQLRMLFLTMLFFIYLTVLPVWDQHYLGRLSLFARVPFLILIGFVLIFLPLKRFIRAGILVIGLMMTLAMAVGEIISMDLHNPNREEIAAAILDLKKEKILTKNDLVLTRNGVEHVVIWFLDAKGGLITALQKDDFQQYNNVYLLSTAQPGISNGPTSNVPNNPDLQQYQYMLDNIDPPGNALEVYDCEYFTLFKIPNTPSEWKFDDTGNWQSFR